MKPLPLLLWLIAAGTAPPLLPAAQGEGRAAGLLVRQVRPGTAGERAGLLPGDLLLSWERTASPPAPSQPSAGPLETPFDLLDVCVEQLPRGGVTLTGRRGEEAGSWLLPGGWPCDLEELRVAPALSGGELAGLGEAEARLAAGDLAAAAPPLEELASTRRAAGDDETAGWLLALLADGFAAAGRFADADAAYARAVAPLERRAQASPAAAHLLRRWGSALWSRSVWEGADDRFRRALAIDRRLAPESLAAAQSLTGRGHVASINEGALPGEGFYREALALRGRLAPGSSAVAESWYDLFHDARLRLGGVRARELLETAVAVQEKAAPESLHAARKLTTLGIYVLTEGEPAAARPQLERALATALRRFPEDPGVPFMLQGLGMASLAQGDPAGAVASLRRAAELAARVSPGTYAEADILHDLGLAERRAGDGQESAAHLCQALGFPERRYRNLTGNVEETLRVGVKFGDFYRDCAAGLAAVGEEERAFEVLERGRARAFLNLLHGRPGPPSAAAAGEGRLLDAEYDQVQETLAELPPGRPDEVERLTGRLREIYRRKEELLAEASASPVRPSGEPLPLAAARRTLDPGTVLLAYVTAREESWLFVLRPAAAASRGGRGLAAYRLAAGRAELEAKVAAFRNLLQDAGGREALLAQGEALYDLLLRPAEPLLAGADRLLISPDGPLHTLPFPALRHGGRFLVEWKPLHFVLSATAYGEIRRGRHPLGNPRLASLVAFGDPDYPQLAAAGAEAPGEALRRGLAPLPATRREVLRIAALFSRGRAYLGREASEERFKSLPPGIRYLHFAVHGLLDRQFPNNSALALSLPREGGERQDNGLLQVWEIARSQNLDVDLVTLSACESALGRDKGGEGLLGLTRAFQYAGARSVLAALWAIPDEATAALMEDFYRRLRAGVPKDRALRAAQIASLRAARGRSSAWAAFQLYGDWR